MTEQSQRAFPVSQEIIALNDWSDFNGVQRGVWAGDSVLADGIQAALPETRLPHQREP